MRVWGLDWSLCLGDRNTWYYLLGKVQLRERSLQDWDLIDSIRGRVLCTGPSPEAVLREHFGDPVEALGVQFYPMRVTSGVVLYSSNILRVPRVHQLEDLWKVDGADRHNDSLESALESWVQEQVQQSDNMLALALCNCRAARESARIFGLGRPALLPPGVGV